MNLLDSVLNEHVQGLYKKRGEAIVEALENKGYHFNSDLEFHNFLKKRCNIQAQQNSPERVLMVDDVSILRWNENINTSHEEGRIKIELG